MASKHILLIIGGGIAAYKSLDLLRALKARGHDVETILTKSGQAFVTPLSVAALNGRPPHTDLFDVSGEAQMRHLALTRGIDLVLIAPATADLLAKMCHGLADDLASTSLLARAAPVLAAPAMNVEMWRNPATQRNISQLRLDGIRFIGPDTGNMACGEHGPGRMSDLDTILAAVEKGVAANGALAGLKIVITSGPTRESFDPVRYLTNRSSGKQGHALAAAARDAGAHVTLVSGPASVPPPFGVNIVPVETADEMLAAAQAALPADIFIGCAAVTDWCAAERQTSKIKKGAGKMALDMVRTPDILSTIAHHPLRPKMVIGFAAETENLQLSAAGKRRDKGCDWILGNDVSGGSVFGANDNALLLVTEQGTEFWPKASKLEQAERLIGKIAEEFAA